MEKTDYFKTTTYKYNDTFYVDIVTTPYDYGACLWHKAMGIKMDIFGMPKKQQSLQEFINIVERALDSDEYINDYMSMYVKE